MATNADHFPGSLVAQAVLAPSSHNTQPWRFRIEGEQLELYADRTRALPVNDPDDRELTISCGAALLNARIAAEHGGQQLDVVLLPDAEDADLLARATLARGGSADERLFAAIAGRRTVRAGFADRAIPREIRVQLADAAAAEGAYVEMLEGERRAGFVALVAEGDRMQFADARWRRELAAWIHPRRKGEGLAYPDMIAPVTRFVVRHFDVGKRVAGRDAKLAAASPAFALLATDGDMAEDWLHAGQALERLLLTAASAGVQASYFNQPMQVGVLRPRASELLERGGFAQLALRLGYPVKQVRSAPRRPSAAVIENP